MLSSEVFLTVQTPSLGQTPLYKHFNLRLIFFSLAPSCSSSSESNVFIEIQSSIIHTEKKIYLLSYNNKQNNHQMQRVTICKGGVCFINLIRCEGGVLLCHNSPAFPTRPICYNEATTENAEFSGNTIDFWEL